MKSRLIEIGFVAPAVVCILVLLAATPVLAGGSYAAVDYPGAANGTMAFGINDAGEVVGAYLDRSNQAHGFIC